MTTTGKVQVRDNGYRKMMNRLMYGKNRSLLVGIFGENADQVHPRSGLTVGEYAMRNEMGEGSTPSRSMIRAWVDNRETAMKKELVRAYARVLRARMSDATEKSELTRLGKKYAQQVRSRIERKRIPPVKNRPRTIARKGFDHPLIETRLLLDSIDHKVEEPGER